MNPNKSIDDILFSGYNTHIPLHHNKATIIDFTENDKQSSVYRKASLKRFKLKRYILSNSPKPVSRICILKRNGK